MQHASISCCSPFPVSLAVSVATKGCLVKQNTINKTWQQPEYLTCPASHPAATPCQQANKNKNKKRNKKTRLPQKSDKGLPGAADSVPDSVCSAPKIKHVEHQLCCEGAGAGAVAAAVDNEEAAMWHVECVGLCG